MIAAALARLAATKIPGCAASGGGESSAVNLHLAPRNLALREDEDVAQPPMGFLGQILAVRCVPGWRRERGFSWRSSAAPVEFLIDRVRSSSVAAGPPSSFTWSRDWRNFIRS